MGIDDAAVNVTMAMSPIAGTSDTCRRRSVTAPPTAAAPMA